MYILTNKKNWVFNFLLVFLVYFCSGVGTTVHLLVCKYGQIHPKSKTNKCPLKKKLKS